MGFVNKVMLLGNTTRDPELRQLPSGTTVCDFGMAMNRVYKTAGGEEREETVFVDCAAFGRLAEVVAEYCPKGRSVFVEGRLHFETWEDKNGNRRNKLSVVAENVQFIGGGGRDTNGEAAAHGRQRTLPLDLDDQPAPAKQSQGTGTAAGGRAPAPKALRGETGTSRAGKDARKPAKTGRRAGGNEDQAIDQMAEETRQLEEADLPF